MYVLCARQLAAAGMDVVCFDYAGTGDSYGDWGAFSLSDWQDNLADVYQYIHELGINDISIIALRFGAFMVTNAVATRQLDFNKCLFWDPIEDGQTYIRQLIRLKIAAAMTEDAQAVTSKEVQAGIEQHGFLEVGGYHITAELLDSINNSKLADSIELLVEQTELHWMVLKNVNQGSSKVVYPICLPENLHDRVRMHAVQDTRFWMQQEVTIAPALLQKTSEIFADDE